MKHFFLFSCILPMLFYSCSNDYQPEYQKELKFDGCEVAVNNIVLKTYSPPLRENNNNNFGELYDETTKWYDINGYHSMTRSISHLKEKTRTTTEQITRDKYSLPVAKNTVIETDGTEPLVTLSRLKRRKNGIEEWLYRHYLDPEKYLEDATTFSFTENQRIISKMDEQGNMQKKGIDIFDQQGRLIAKYPVNMEEPTPYIKNYYIGASANLDSIVSVVYQNNDSTQTIIQKNVEYYNYKWNDKGLPIIKNSFKNDSLIYITTIEYEYR